MTWDYYGQAVPESEADGPVVFRLDAPMEIEGEIRGMQDPIFPWRTSNELGESFDVDIGTLFGIHHIRAALIGSRQALEEVAAEYEIPRNVIIAVFNDPYQILVEITIYKEDTGIASFVGRLGYSFDGGVVETGPPNVEVITEGDGTQVSPENEEPVRHKVAQWTTPWDNSFFPFPGNESLGLEGTNVGKMMPGASPEDEAGGFALSLVSENLNRSIGVLHDLMVMEAFGTVFTLFGYEIWRTPLMKQEDFDTYMSLGVAVVSIVYPPAGKAVQGLLCASKIVELFQDVTNIIEESDIQRGQPLTDKAWASVGGGIKTVTLDGLSAFGSCMAAHSMGPLKQETTPGYLQYTDMGDGTARKIRVFAYDKYSSLELLKSKIQSVGAKSFCQFIWKAMTGAPDAEGQTSYLEDDMLQGLRGLVDGFLEAFQVADTDLPSDAVEAASLSDSAAREILSTMAPKS